MRKGAIIGITISSDEKGKFKVNLTPGVYTISTASSAVMPTLSPINVTVEANKYTSVNVNFDSGIRLAERVQFNSIS